MSDKLEMPIEQFAEAVAKENARLNNRIEKLEAVLKGYSCSCSTADEHDCELGDWANTTCGLHARKALEGNPEKSVYKEGYRAVEEAMGHPSPEFWIEKRE